MTIDNIRDVYDFCEENVEHLSHSFETFKSATLESTAFLPDFTITATDKEGKIIAFFMVVFRKPYLFKKRRTVAVLKFFVVARGWRYKGLGSEILTSLTARIKTSEKRCFWMKFEVLSAMPDYWLPGLDPRHTEALFFLKKHGFKRKGERMNLRLSLKNFSETEPASRIGNIEIRRAKKEEEHRLIPLQFMPMVYHITSWPPEIKISFQNTPISSFIALDTDTNEIIGWATHSVSFPGSFGPTGVSKKYRGRGLGGFLLQWCLWDLKRSGIQETIIRWVEEDTAYFYLKSVGAHISELYWPMQKRI